MITYVDSSTLVKLIIDEDGSPEAELIWHTSETLASARLVVVEARAALAAASRAGRLTVRQHRDAKRELASLIANLHLVEITETLITDAANLVEAEALRGYDAIHLAAAMLAGASVLTSADTELCEAAGRRGLHIANPLSGPPAP